MVTNITVNTVENMAIIYLMDGSTISVDPQQTQSLQLVDLGFCTISEASTPEDNGEHMPPGMAFAGKMKDFWTAFWQKIKDEAEQVPKPTPY